MYRKMWQLRNALPKIKKDQKVSFGSTKYNYFNIEKMIDLLVPELEKLHLAVFQPLTSVQGRPAIRTIIVDLENDKTFEDVYPLPDNVDSQKQGGAVTYFRRYCLLSLLFLETEEDADSQSYNQKIRQTKKQPMGNAPLPTQQF